MLTTSHSSLRLALFCKVVDNFGDIGICWRLARQLQREHQIAVTLWVDDLVSFQKICPDLNVDLPTQMLQEVYVRLWQNQDDHFQISDVAEIVIEFFACDIPPAYIATMAQCQPKPVWINLEGLSAEEWVEGCHTLPSSHPQYSLTKYFFFPGFTHKTGGLLLEQNLIKDRESFQQSPHQRVEFLGSLGLEKFEIDNFLISLFCYPHAAVGELFQTWENTNEPITCLVPVGVARQAVEQFLRSEAIAGAHARRGNLTVRVIPFVPQQDYDQLLWCCDFNFVRGEDSFVRAQWANKPFIWHIYPQDENLHHKKLHAFLQRHDSTSRASQDFSLAWNDAIASPDWSVLWTNLFGDLIELQKQSEIWQREMREIGDMTLNLMKFIHEKRQNL
ncbi:elongation factor P maturation arginine rhamnosyltransferase EarP [Undibacterium sp.]|uniref:elongation factor P maturation arginine rhamnosyltransferase EarP n=1 Tax=Undibacterium sp. TaxID=1914977 RepID=UPI003753A361